MGVASPATKGARGRDLIRKSAGYALSPQQRQHALRRGIRRSEHGGAGLRQDLRTRHRRRFRRKVRVADRALARRDILQRDAQAVDVGLQRVALEGAQAAADDRNLPNGALDDLAGSSCASVAKRCAAAGDDVGEEPDPVVAEVGRSNRLNAEADLLIRVDLGAKLELRAAAGDGKAGLPGAERGVDGELQVEVGGVERDVEPVGDGERAVDGRDRIDAGGARRGIRRGR
jgi:hypothetical protein